MDLQYIYYGLLELFDQRNGVVHGKIIFTDIKDENFKLKVEKYVKIAKKSYTLQHIEYGSGFLRNGLRDAHYFRGIVGTAKALITGEFDPVANREEMMKGHIKWQRTTEGLRNMGYIVEE